VGDAAPPGSAPGVSAQLPPLDDGELEVLRRVGRHWGRAVGDEPRRALPVDPGLGGYPDEIRPGRFSRVVSVESGEAQQTGVEVTDDVPPRRTRIRRVLLGAPLRSTALAKEKMRKLVALPVLSADALSSVAYGPEAMIAVLVLAAAGGLSLSLPIAGAIAFLMLATGVSYRQTIRAYPNGGGSYVVASDNLGRRAGLTAAAGLMTDYVLTVALSVASGVAAVTSAVPSVGPAAVPIGVGAIAVLLAGNLRGVRQAGSLFAAPTYAFIAAMAVLVAVGLTEAAGRGFHATPHPPIAATEGVGLLLVLRAFASGSTAMTGVEAISNAVPAFQPPGWRNARTALTIMVGILIVLFAGTVTLVHLDGIVPSGSETVLSQLAHRSFGSGPLYAYTQAATAAVLLLAANTAFNDFPRVLSLMARDGQAPRMFLRMGDRLAFSNGIAILAVASATILVAFDGKTSALIPLYAVGVFLAFALSQTGMVVHWRRHRGAHWRKSMVFNGTGAVLSAIVFVIAGVTKFAAGAWVSILVILLVVVGSSRIRRHYATVHRALALHRVADEVPQPPTDPGNGRPVRQPTARDTESEESPEAIRHLAIVPVRTIDLAAMRALAYAASLGQPVLAVHISPTPEEADRFLDYWRTWGDHLPLEVVVSPYRALVAPLVQYVEALHRQRPDLTLTVILPEIVVRHPWHRVLHGRTASRLGRALRSLDKIVVTTVPVHLPD
jgi:amino acid transporter